MVMINYWSIKIGAPIKSEYCLPIVLFGQKILLYCIGPINNTILTTFVGQPKLLCRALVIFFNLFFLNWSIARPSRTPAALWRLASGEYRTKLIRWFWTIKKQASSSEALRYEQQKRTDDHEKSKKGVVIFKGGLLVLVETARGEVAHALAQRGKDEVRVLGTEVFVICDLFNHLYRQADLVNYSATAKSSAILTSLWSVRRPERRGEDRKTIWSRTRIWRSSTANYPFETCSAGRARPRRLFST